MAPSSLSVGLAPNRQRISHGLMGTSRFIVHVMLKNIGLLNLLSLDAFSEVKVVKKNTFASGALPRTLLWELAVNRSEGIEEGKGGGKGKSREWRGRIGEGDGFFPTRFSS